MRRPERGAVDESGAGSQLPRRRVDPGDVPGGRVVEVGQESGQPGGEEGLAGAGRSDQEQVVPTGGCRLEGTAGDRLSEDIGQVARRDRGRTGRPPVGRPVQGRRVRPRASARAAGHQLGQRGDRIARSAGQAGLVQAPLGDDQAMIEQCVGQHQRAGHAPDRTVETELADEGEPVDGSLVEHAGGNQDAHGDGQIQAGPRFAHAGRGQVHGDPAPGPREAARHQGGSHPVSRLAHGGVRQADHGQSGQPVGHVDLDGHRAAVDPEEDGGGDAGDH